MMDPKMKEWIKQTLHGHWRGSGSDMKGGSDMVEGNKSGRKFGIIGGIIAIIAVLLLANPIAVIPAGHVGVKDFFGMVSPDILPPPGSGLSFHSQGW